VSKADVRKLLSAGRRFVDLQVYVKPEARETRLTVEGGELVFYTEEPPVKGRANAALVKALSKMLGIPSSRIRIVGGVRSRSKRVRLMNMDAEILAERLAEILGGEDA